MPVTNRLFTYSATPITGASQSGNLAISTTYIPGYTWWGGPDESTCYIIAHSDNVVNKRTERNRGATISTNSVGFWKTTTQSDDDFLSMFNGLFKQSYGSASVAAYWLNTNGYWTSYTPETPFASESFITGGFLSYNGLSKNGLVKLNTDGTDDSTFSVGTGFSQSTPGAGLILSYSSIVQDDGKVIVGGSFTSYNGTAKNNIIRLNTNGTIDNTFTIGTGFDGLVLKITKQTNGKIIVVGGYLSYNGVASREIIRLNTDGSVDNTFSAGTGFNGSLVYDAKIQADGKIVVVGNHTSYNGTTSKSIIRLNTDGTVDNTFSVGTAFNGGMYTVCLQNDGKILAGGSFTYYNSLYRSRIIRLNSDGTDDNTFNTGSGFNGDVRNIKIQADGKILVCGQFTSYNGTTSNNIIRLNTNGLVDNTFSIGTGFGNAVYDIKIQADGKIIVVGFFTSYNGTSCNGIIRLNVDGTIDNTFSIGTGLIGPDAPYATSIT